jgi:hypothetical protein
MHIYGGYSFIGDTPSTVYSYNNTIVYPYYENNIQVGGTVKINSDAQQYDFMANISYVNGTLFAGTYNVYGGFASNVISTALNFQDNTLIESGVVDPNGDFVSNGFDTEGNYFDFYFGVPVGDISVFEYSSTFYGIKFQFINSTAGVNTTAEYLFILDDYLGNNAEYGDPTPTPSFTISWGSGTVPTSWTTILAYAVGLTLSFIGLVVLMKVPAGWMPALFMIAVGLVVSMAAWTSIYGLAGWSLIVLISPVFLYAGRNGGK